MKQVIWLQNILALIEELGSKGFLLDTILIILYNNNIKYFILFLFFPGDMSQARHIPHPMGNNIEGRIMMEINELVNLALNSGVAIVVIIFFMYRDIKFMSQLQTTLTALVDTVNALKDVVEDEKAKKGK